MPMLMWHLNCVNLLFYRLVSRWHKYQTFLHTCLGGWLALPLQWYSLFFIGIFFTALYSLLECLQYDSLQAETVARNLDEIYTFNVEQNYTIFSGFCRTGECIPLERTEFQDSLHVHNWLSLLSKGGHVAALIAVLVNVVHVTLVVRRFSHFAAEDERWCRYPWKMTTRMDWLLLIFCMPMVICAAALRASSRSWQLMTGNCPCSRGALPCENALRTPWDHRFPRIEHFEFALYRSDLELAAMFQFYAIFAFVRLIGEYVGDREIFPEALRGKLPRLEHSVAEYQSVIKTAALLGAWAFVILGTIRSIVSWVTAEMETFPQTLRLAEKVESQLLSSLRMVFALLTIVCVVNMLVICKMERVEEKMPRANAKFTGARMLLVVMEVQKSVLSVFTFGSPFNLRVKQVLGHEGFTLFSPERYFLLHVTLLTWECLGIVALNFFWWKPWSMELDDAQLTPRFERDNTGLATLWRHVLSDGGVHDSHRGNGAQLSGSSSDASSEADSPERPLISDGSFVSDASRPGSARRILSCV